LRWFWRAAEKTTELDLSRLTPIVVDTVDGLCGEIEELRADCGRDTERIDGELVELWAEIRALKGHE
jgi:hypothetical protein